MTLAVQFDSGECQGCRCTEATPCITLAGPCRWVAPGLCSACADGARELYELAKAGEPITFINP